MNLSTRRLGIFAGLVILLGGFVGFRFLSQMKDPPQRKANTTTVRQVDTLHHQNMDIPTALDIQGELAAYDKIDIFAEVSGTLESSSRPFKVGSYFPKNAVLLRIDDEEARLNLLAQKSNLLNAITQLMPDLKIDHPASFDNWNGYLQQFDPEKPIAPFPEPLNQQEKYFIAARNLYNQYYSIKSAEERLSKYTIKAPFGGVITLASINPGAVVRAGQKLGELMNTGNYELVATVPLRDLKYIREGNEVTLLSDDIDGQWTGRIRRINDQVDPGTQTIKAFISVRGAGLREGMYLRGSIEGSKIENASRLPRNLLVDQKSVFVVRDSFLRLEEVQVVKITEEAAIVRGLDNGTPLLRQPIPNAFDGMKVAVKPKQEADAAMGAQEEAAPNAMGSLE